MELVRANVTMDFMKIQEFVLNVMEVVGNVMELNIIIARLAPNQQNYLMEFVVIQVVMNVIIIQRIHALIAIMGNILIMESVW